MSVRYSFRKIVLVSVAACLSSGLGGCELTQNYLKHDRENSFEPQDYRDALAPRQVDIDRDARSSGNIPELKPYVAQPNLDYKPMPLVSVSVNQTIPLRDVLYEVTQQAGFDAEIDPRIRGSIIFSAKNRPLDMVVEHISEIAGLRYKFDDGILRVELDTPYHEIYKINYLALTRTNTSSIKNDISIVSGEGADTGSSFEAANESVLDFWAELEENLTQIVESNRDSNRLATSRDPRVTVADSNPAPVQPIVMDEDGNIAQNGPNVQVQAPAAVLNVNSLPLEDEDSSDDEEAFAARFSVNKQAGLVSVFAPERLHKKVAEYMKELKKSVTSQVLIEAKVLEVSLNDEFSAGIDWSLANVGLLGGSMGIGFGPQNFDSDGTTATGLVRAVISGAEGTNSSFSISGSKFNNAVEALAQFGTVQALASPRLTVLNNQSAALNVARNVVYFEIETDSTVSAETGDRTTSYDTSAKTVPEGVLINVQPAIDLDLRRVAMAIRPTITSISSFTNDPNPDLSLANVESPIPNVNVQEFDSIIQVNDGQAVVLGGMIQDRVESTRQSVPVLGELPFMGAAFRRQRDFVRKTELVVFLKATIVDGNETIHNTDKDLYRTFSSDRRPLRL
jgi:general secretion pathway protein D